MVQVQRKMRLFQSKDIAALLREHGIPKLRHLNKTLPLSDFDSDEFETRDPAAWVPPAPGMPAAPAKVVEVAASGRLEVTPCAALSYDAKTKLYTVEMSRSGEIRAVPRVALCFSAEDPELFAARVATAHALRADAEDEITSELFSDCMPVDDLPGPGEDMLSRVLDTALSTRKLRERSDEEKTRALLAEVEHDYKRTLNKIALSRSIEEGAGDVATGQRTTVDPGMLVKIPVLPPVRPPKAVPAKGCGEPPPLQPLSRRHAQAHPHTNRNPLR